MYPRCLKRIFDWKSAYHRIPKPASIDGQLEVMLLRVVSMLERTESARKISWVPANTFKVLLWHLHALYSRPADHLLLTKESLKESAHLKTFSGNAFVCEKCSLATRKRESLGRWTLFRSALISADFFLSLIQLQLVRRTGWPIQWIQRLDHEAKPKKKPQEMATLEHFWAIKRETPPKKPSPKLYSF